MPDFKQRPDSGILFSKDSKKSEKAPDYGGEIAIDIRNMTSVKEVDGLLVFRLSGWKRKGANGKTYLSLAVDRYEKRQEAAPQPKRVEEDLDF
jgi:hypothetical protein